MATNSERHVPPSRARRHFLGLTFAIGARVAAASAAAMIIPSLPAQAKGKWWGKPGGGNGNSKGGGGGNNCFLRGTSIMTPTGETPIEELGIGDLVETVRGETLAIKWIGRRLYKTSGSSWPENVMPIRVSRQALDQRTPHKDLYLSPDHALFIDGVLIRVKELVNGISIVPALPAGQENIEYFQIVLDTHEVILADGAPAETFLFRANNHENFTNFAEYDRLYPADGRRPAMTPFAPVVGYEGGRQHLKALLLLGASPFVHWRDPVRDVYERIAVRAGQLVT
ncbi:Hint domain-containing protein [Phyllobacterium bourgognense]|uniref:Hint domain-containing protein n=1 Tax=Phyllobacterium bourgognense TaxID=314236 RepID=A0A368YYP0_9HYPH|nr:Hint domain-containing protein [Phyllobacterium bourgognense]RCW85301.1 Hint domain-containing protein [Phyllobacterium bourgognense]